ncbi:MAG: AAA family ATPase [Cytophagales bacterium]|nr:AAA family ATPase [Cytophagales bacterium]
MNIFLVGIINSGKTSLGKELACKLNFEFIDSDTRIASSEGCSINQIFKEKGLMYFRKLEKDFLRQIVSSLQVNSKKTVIATGGGMPCFYDNMNFMNDNGITVFLDVTIQEIIKRLSKGGYDLKQKPMLKGYKKKELYHHLTKLREKRLKFYSMAKIKLSGDSISCEDIIRSF